MPNRTGRRADRPQLLRLARRSVSAGRGPGCYSASLPHDEFAEVLAPGPRCACVEVILEIRRRLRLADSGFKVLAAGHCGRDRRRFFGIHMPCSGGSTFSRTSSSKLAPLAVTPASGSCRPRSRFSTACSAAAESARARTTAPGGWRLAGSSATRSPS